MLRRLGKDVAIYGGTDFLFKFAQLLVVPIYAHLLSVEDFGTLALITVSASLLGSLVNLGVNYAVLRFYLDPETPEEDRPVLVSTGLAQLLLSSLVIVGASILVLRGMSDELMSAYQLPWLLILLGLLTVPADQVAQYALDTTRLQFAPLKFCAISLVKNVAGLLLGLWLLVQWRMGIYGLLLGSLAATTVAVLVGLWLIRRDLTFRYRWTFGRRLLHFGYPLIFTTAAYWVFGSLDRWMLLELSDSTQVGLVSIAFRFATVVTFVVGAFQQAWFPHAMRAMREDESYTRTYSRIFSAWFLLLGLIALGLGLFAPEIMVLLTREEYWPAAPVLSVAAAAMAVSGTTLFTGLGVTLERRTALLAIGAWLAAAANVGFNLLVIPRWGALGAVFGTLTAYVVLTLFFLYWSQKLHRIPLEHGKLLYGCLLVGATLLSPLVFGAGSIGWLMAMTKLGILAAAVLGAVAAGILTPDLLRQLAYRTGKPTP